MFSQLLINGIIAGAIYALIASGFSLIYSTNRFVHFAHGTVSIFGGYLLYWFYSLLGLDFWLAALFSVASTALIGYLLNKIVYSSLRKRKSSPSILLIASVGIMILIEALMLFLFGADVKTIGLIPVSKGLMLFGAFITPLQVAIVATSAILFIALYLLMNKTKVGKAMRAVSDNKDVAEIVGISAEKIYSWSFIFGSAIAGVAGILISLEQNLEPTMGTALMVKGFAGAIIGGVGSVPGAIVGSLFLGLAENFGIWYLPSGYKDAIAFLVLFIFLLFKPNGIFNSGKRVNG
ncbi:MAG: branched-chain amino acid ABC transporter permease [Candidatus Berkelbacteria bacterium]|nr:branched-chain amino acid ABC transporter permease [Candidatus Berkelbacteria bacterium]MCR4307306.1 branched-chain amino acid ABC transporter permease [Candidatus Berkelbacteria bacterium]